MTEEEVTPVRACTRAFAIEDLTVRSDGSGRVVEAYAATFSDPTEIMDGEGHYAEELSPGSFTKTIREKGPNATGPGRFGVLFNHGRTVDGASSDTYSMPIGVPLEVAADSRGVYTATRYLDNPVASHVLDAIKAGAIRAQSFSGRFIKSTRSWPNGRGADKLSRIVRHEVDMREYGPAVFAAYESALILGTRAEMFVDLLLSASPEDRLSLLSQYEISTKPNGPAGGTSPAVAARFARIAYVRGH